MAVIDYIDSLGQIPPFRYIDELVCINLQAREAKFALHLHPEKDRYGNPDALQGYLLIEAMAQAGGVLLRAVTFGESGGYLVGLENTRIPEQISSSSIFIDVSMTMARSPIFSFSARITNDLSCIAESEIQIMSKRNLNVHYGRSK